MIELLSNAQLIIVLVLAIVIFIICFGLSLIIYNLFFKVKVGDHKCPVCDYSAYYAFDLAVHMINKRHHPPKDWKVQKQI